MKAISVQQPWAWLIVRGYKDIENRSWLTKQRGRVLIHAGQKFDHRALTNHRLRGTILSILTANGLKPEDLQRGGIVGSVEIVDCVAFDPGMWFDGENDAATIANNLIEDHPGNGIMYEVSGSGTITDNIIRRSDVGLEAV